MVPDSTLLARANRKEMGRFLKFAVVGAIGAVVDFGVLNFLVLVAGLAPLQANPFSFSAAVISNFTWNRLWTYPESRKFKKRAQLPKFILVNLVGLGINQLVLGVVLHLVASLGLQLRQSLCHRRRALLELWSQPAVDLPRYLSGDESHHHAYRA